MSTLLLYKVALWPELPLGSLKLENYNADMKIHGLRLLHPQNSLLVSLSYHP